jgi:hypothetical protein
MACPSGCSNGGGQIKPHDLSRVNLLYAESLLPEPSAGAAPGKACVRAPGEGTRGDGPCGTRDRFDQDVRGLRALLQARDSAGGLDRAQEDVVMGVHGERSGASGGIGGSEGADGAAAFAGLQGSPLYTAALHTTFRIRELSLDSQLLEW